MNLDQIGRNESLYGHTLLTSPQKIWKFAKADCWCVPDNYVILHDYIIAKRVRYRTGRTWRYCTEFVGQQLIENSSEWLCRRMLGTLATGIASVTLLPLGFAAKCLHLGARHVSTWLASTNVAQVWNNTELVGHLLTSAPRKCYDFAAAPLVWHLREDGTDRRAYIYQANVKTGYYVEHQSEYPLVPLELFEFPYRRMLGGALTLTSALLSPLGLAAKEIHLASRSALAR